MVSVKMGSDQARRQIMESHSRMGSDGLASRSGEVHPCTAL